MEGHANKKKRSKQMEKLMTTKELLKEIGMSRTTLYRYLHEGMPYISHSPNQRKRLYVLEDVKQFIKSRKNPIDLVEGQVYTNEQVQNAMRVEWYGDVRKSHTKNAIMIVSHAENPESMTGLNDYVDENTVLYYTGPEKDDKNAKTLTSYLYEAERHKGDSHIAMSVHIFFKHQGNEYLYRGRVVPADAPYEEVVIGDGGVLQTVFKYPLKFHTPTKNWLALRKEIREGMEKAQECFAKKVGEMRMEELESINEKIVEKNAANDQLLTPEQKLRHRPDVFVSEYVIRKAQDTCQLCGKKVDLNDWHMPPRLLCVPIPPLEGGMEDKYHAAALCPNCKSRVLYGISEPMMPDYLRKLMLRLEKQTN